MNKCYNIYMEGLPEDKGIMELVLKMGVMIKAHFWVNLNQTEFSCLLRYIIIIWNIKRITSQFPPSIFLSVFSNTGRICLINVVRAWLPNVIKSCCVSNQVHTVQKHSFILNAKHVLQTFKPFVQIHLSNGKLNTNIHYRVKTRENKTILLLHFLCQSISPNTILLTENGNLLNSILSLL